MNIDKVKPLFIWAGGKNKMLKHYKSLIPKIFDIYYEPFFGGGAMFLHIMTQEHKPKKIYINDINEDVIKIHKAIQSNVEEFIKELDELCNHYLSLDKVGKAEYFFKVRQWNAFDNWKSLSAVKLSAVMYFLFKTGFNGIYQINKNTGGRYGTPPGLLNQKNTVYDKENVYKWHKLLENAEITCKDWKEVCKQEDNAFYFLDPPYRGSFTSYGQDFGDEEQNKLIYFAKNVSNKSHVMLCNRDIGDSFFDENKEHLKIERYNVTYTAGRRKQIKDEDKKITSFEAKKAREILLHNLS
jgi:DNA adenine methylase